jgi:hypothetical protein
MYTMVYSQVGVMKEMDDAPIWSSIYDTHYTWSRIIDGWHGRTADYTDDGGGMGYGWIKDAGGLTRTYEVQTEEDEIDVIHVTGQGYLNDTGI